MTPYLYTLESELLVDGTVVDSERTPFGIRQLRVDAEHGFPTERRADEAQGRLRPSR